MSARIFNEGGQKVRVPSFQEVLLRHTDRVSGYMVRALTADLVAAQRHRPSHKEQKQPLDAIASPPLQDGPSEGPCPTALQRTARERLVAFDVVGVTSCMRDWYDALGRRLRWTCLRDSAVIDAAEKYSHNEYYKPHESNREVRAFVEASADDELSPDAAAALRSAAACDGPVYLDGLRRAGLAGPAVSADGEPTDDHHSLADPGGEGVVARGGVTHAHVSTSAGASARTAGTHTRRTLILPMRPGAVLDGRPTIHTTQRIHGDRVEGVSHRRGVERVRSRNAGTRMGVQ